MADNLKISLRQIATNNCFYDSEFDKSSMETFNKHDPANFLQKVRIFGDSTLDSITAEECDYLFNGLLLDKNLYNRCPVLWNNYASYLCDTIAYLTSLISIKHSYSKEYVRFMQEREFYRNNHKDSTFYLSKYNNIIIDWRVGKKE